MEITLGSTVRTLVAKTVDEYPDKKILLKKGIVGRVCDDFHKDEGWVFVEFSDPEILAQGTGVYEYTFSEIELVMNR